MRLIPGTRLELVRCTGCGWVQILNGWGCGRCGGKVEELFGEPDPVAAEPSQVSLFGKAS